VYMFIYVPTEFASVSIYVYIYENWVYIYLYMYLHIYTQKHMCVGIWFHTCTPGLQLCARRVYLCVCIYLHTCARVRIHTEFSCVIFSVFTYVGHRPVEVELWVSVTSDLVTNGIWHEHLEVDLVKLSNSYPMNMLVSSHCWVVVTGHYLVTHTTTHA